MTIRVAAVMPTYNNAGTVLAVIDGILTHLDALIVVNDGATDGTAELLATRPELEVVQQPENRGKGAALRRGFARARELGHTHAITLDSDAQHDPGQLPRFEAAIMKHPGAIIVGARDMDGPTVPAKSRFGRRLSNQGVALLTGRLLPDTQTGYRAYPLEPILGLGATADRFEFEIEILVRALWAGMAVHSISIPVVYQTGSARVTHFRPVVDFCRGIALDLRLLRERDAARRRGVSSGSLRSPAPR
jgi:glycosyltransferase involved in cell wall biosynthesis